MTDIRFSPRHVIRVLAIVAVATMILNTSAASAQSPLGAAQSFAVLAGPAVTCTDSTIDGDVGIFSPVPPGSSVTQTNCTINGTIHAGDATAVAAYNDFLSAYNALGQKLCGQTLTGTLANVTLGPGVYCFDAAATLTGVLTLNGPPNGSWIFLIGTSGTGALTGTGFSVVMANGVSPCNVYWWVAEAATMTTSNFQGTILAGAAITITGGTFNGDAWAKAAVTLTGANVAGCGSGSTLPPVQPPFYNSIKVTGGGQIPVPDPASNGRATFGFNAMPDNKGGAKGNLNYVNHVTGLHINGKVDNIVVIEVNADNSPKTVLFSGTYEGGSFIVTVQDNAEPGTLDQFGITVIGDLSEVRLQRVISRGNIQFHKE